MILCVLDRYCYLLLNQEKKKKVLFKAQLDSLKVVLETNHKIYLWEGSVRSGKTTAISAAIPIMMHKMPVGDFAIVGVSQSTIERNVVRSMKEVLGEKNVFHHEGKQRVYCAGRTFAVIGAADDRAEARIKGSTFAGVIVDEVTKIPEEVFMTLIQRISLPGAFIMCSTNPDGPHHWFKRNYIDKKEEVGLYNFIMMLEDNIALPVDYVRTLKASNTGVWYKRFVEGLWAKSEGLVFPTFTDEHVIEHNNWTTPQWSVAVDFGSTNPCVFLLMGVDRNAWPRVWVEKERYFSSKIEGHHKTELEHANDCLDFCLENGAMKVYVDPSAISFITALRKEARLRGVNIHVIAANNEVLPGIHRIANLLGTGDLKIKKVCKNLINEFHTYAWSENKTILGKDEPIKQHDHCIDALRYFVSSSGVADHAYETPKKVKQIDSYICWEKDILNKISHLGI
jgi:PBSX family phage terminase large subunit